PPARGRPRHLRARPDRAGRPGAGGPGGRDDRADGAAAEPAGRAGGQRRALRRPACPGRDRPAWHRRLPVRDLAAAAGMRFVTAIWVANILAAIAEVSLTIV